VALIVSLQSASGPSASFDQKLHECFVTDCDESGQIKINCTPSRPIIFWDCSGEPSGKRVQIRVNNTKTTSSGCTNYPFGYLLLNLKNCYKIIRSVFGNEFFSFVMTSVASSVV
jgi:hypothetical protein